MEHPENSCKPLKSRAWNCVMRYELMSLLALAMLLPTGARAGELPPQSSNHLPPGVIPACGSWENIASILADKYDEHPIAYSTGGGGEWGEQFVLELFTSPDGGTWTMVITTAATGVSCVASAGRNWTWGSIRLAPGDPS